MTKWFFCLVTLGLCMLFSIVVGTETQQDVTVQNTVVKQTIKPWKILLQRVSDLATLGSISPDPSLLDPSVPEHNLGVLYLDQPGLFTPYIYENSDIPSEKVSSKNLLVKFTDSESGFNFGLLTIECQSACQADLIVHLNSRGEPHSFLIFNVRNTKNSAGELLKIDRVVLRPQQLGPKPHLLLGYEDEHTKKLAAEANQSFFSKYWYIIVPGMLLMLLTSGPPEEEGQAEGSQAPDSQRREIRS